MKRRFLLDNDGSNIFHNLPAEADDAMIARVICDTIHECPPEVTTYLLCSNAGTAYFPSAVMAMDPRAVGLQAAVKRGSDPFGQLLRALKQAGREVFVTMRMNDVHNPTDADQWNTPRLRREHPDYVVGADEIKAGHASWMSYCLDYARPEVRAYYLDFIRDLAARYADVLDGVQLDWMRFPRHLPGTPEQVWERRANLTEFTAGARQALQAAGGHLQLAARVPPTLEGCRNLGLDLAAWTAGGLVDFLVLCPFLTTNWQMPIGDFRDLLGEHPVPLYGGFDFGYGNSSHHPESLHGVCASLYDCGADGLYLFNFPCWTEYLAARPYHWLRGLDDPATAAVKPLQVAVAHHQHRHHVTDGPGELPVKLPPHGQHSLSIYVPGSALPAWRCLVLIHGHGDVGLSVGGAPAAPLRFRPDEWSGSDGHRSELFLEFADHYFRKDVRPKPQACRLFRVEVAALQPGVNQLTVTNLTDHELEIERVLLGLW